MYEKTTIAFAFAAGALLSGVVTAGSAMVIEHLLFAKGGRIEVPVTREVGSKAGVVPCPDERADGRVTDYYVAPRRVLARGATSAPRDSDAEGAGGRHCGRRPARTPAEV